jgi:ABC-type sulfate transport system permease component
MAGTRTPVLDERAQSPVNGAHQPAALRHLISHRRRRFPWLLGPMSAIVVAALLSPLVLILIQSVQAGWSQIWPALDRAFVVELLWNTVRLAILVTALSAVLGTGAAWLTERTDLPGRRVWSVLLIVPLVVPERRLRGPALPDVHHRDLR